MKKIVLIILLGFMLFGCEKTNFSYTNDDAFEMSCIDSFRILQVTDLHLTYGIDSNDAKTFALIKELNETYNPDLIAVTGDITMTPLVRNVFKIFLNEMEKLKTPWTFVLGNHDNDFINYEELLSLLTNEEYLYFKVGPEMIDGGYGNFKISITRNNLPFYNLYMLDSKNEYDDGYGFFSQSQVEWFDSHLADDGTTNNLVFMHIPLIQYKDYENYEAYDGEVLENGVSAQGLDTNFFNVCITHGLTKGIFAGHDHLNDLSFYKDNILLAYGRSSGYNGYGGTSYKRGGRIIDLNQDGSMTSNIVFGGN